MPTLLFVPRFLVRVRLLDPVIWRFADSVLLRKRDVSRHLQAVAWVFLFSAVGHAAELPAGCWPVWRGPYSMGSTDSGEYPVKWTAEDGLAWKAELPGRGCSTPVVWGDHIILTAPIDGQDAVVDLDLSGNTRWQTALGPQRQGKHRNGSGCNPSAVTDGRFIFVYYKSGRRCRLLPVRRTTGEKSTQRLRLPACLRRWRVHCESPASLACSDAVRRLKGSRA